MNIDLLCLNPSVTLLVLKSIFRHKYFTVKSLCTSLEEFNISNKTISDILIIEYDYFKLISKSNLSNYFSVLIIFSKRKDEITFIHKSKKIHLISLNSIREEFDKSLLTIYNQNFNFHCKVEKELEKLNLNSYLKGYKYIKSGICLLNESNYLIENLELHLYTKIAKIYKCSKDMVKWNIISALKTLENNNSTKKINDYFNFYEEQTLTPKVFFANIINKLQ